MCNSRGIEGQAISARWRSLTHSYLPRLPPKSALLVERVAKVLCYTGSFSSFERSLEFVQAIALDAIEAIVRLSLRLESAFMVEVTSSDMSLLFEGPGTVFDDARMTSEFRSSGVSTPGRQDRIAGTTGVGVRKSVCEGAGKGHRTQILLKTTVVLERDVVDSQGIDSGGNGDIATE